MAYIGTKPADKPLTAADITDGIITSAKIVDGTIANADISSTAAITLNKLSSNPSFRNRIINGDMQIDQRNNGSAVTVNDYATFFSVDRFRLLGQSSDGVFTAQRSSTAPTGFVNSLLITVTTADASIGSSQEYTVRQNIEGYNVADLGFGTANAKTITLSFWVRSSVTGAFGGSFMNNNDTRTNPFSYTINSANTWEYKTITITGDTSGTWQTTTSTGLCILWSLGVGTGLKGTAGTWSGSSFYAPTSSVNLISTLNATLYITGVQLEAGDQASGFEFMPFDIDLMRCQRYYYLHVKRSGNFEPVGIAWYETATLVATNITFKSNMRTDPTLVSGSGTDYYRVDRNGGQDNVNSFTLGSSYETNSTIYNNSQASGTGGQAGGITLNNDGAYIAFESEL